MITKNQRNDTCRIAKILRKAFKSLYTKKLTMFFKCQVRSSKYPEHVPEVRMTSNGYPDYVSEVRMALSDGYIRNMFQMSE